MQVMCRIAKVVGITGRCQRSWLALVMLLASQYDRFLLPQPGMPVIETLATCGRDTDYHAMRIYLVDVIFNPAYIHWEMWQ